MWIPVIGPRTALRSHFLAAIVAAGIVWYDFTQQGGHWPLALGIGTGIWVLAVFLAWTATRDDTLRIAARFWNVAFAVVIATLAINIFTPGPLPTWAYVVIILAGVTGVAPILYFGAVNIRAWLADLASPRP